MPVFKLKLEIEQLGVGLLDLPTNVCLNETEGMWMAYSLAHGSTDQAIPMSFTTGITTVDMLVMTSDKQVSWKKSATDEAHTLDADGILLMFGTSITNFLITNASGDTATIRLGVAG